VSSADAALLVVDDNEDNRYTLTRRLTREGYRNLTTAANGREALDLLRSRKFDLVLLDIMMPDMNGYEVLEHLKAEDLQNIPVIMISALSEIDSVVRCIELGAEDYLPKPFNPTLLRARVGASLEKKRLRDEVRQSLARLEKEMDSARRLQMSMLPRDFPACTPEQPVEVHASMEPAREVGGDLYDCFYASTKLFCFLVGDVSGKGASAAMFMARARSLVRMAIELRQQAIPDRITPSGVAEAVNRELCQNNDDRMFVTLFLGLLDTQTGALTYTNAGHPSPHILRASGQIEQIEGRPQIPLGIRKAAEYESQAVALQPGDAVFVVSDGVAEATNAAGAFYTLKRLASDLRSAFTASAAELVCTITSNVRTFSGSAPKSDDVTALALRWRSTQFSDHSAGGSRSPRPTSDY
jgi:sigma-B regulation protein RsbU (phosphoserine phosphatase)